MDKRIYWVWLQQALGCGYAHTGRLLRTFGSAERVWLADEESLRAAGLTGTALKKAMNKAVDKAGKQLRAAVACGWQVWTPDMPEYPAPWKEIADPPLAIYATGTLPADWQQRPVVTVLATRRISTNGLLLTGKIAAGLATGGVIIAGDTISGGDAAVMAAVASVGGCGILLQPCGLDVSYPKTTEYLRDEIVKGGGVMLSEFPAGTTVRKENYRLRNRLLAALPHAMIVTEAPDPSGTLQVARLASTNGRDVFAVPGDLVTHAGCHQLIREQAMLVRGAEDVARELSIKFPSLDVKLVANAEQAYVPRPPKTPVKAPAKKKSLRAVTRREPPEIKLLPTEPLPELSVADLPASISDNAKCILPHLTERPQGLEELTEKTPLSLPQAMMALTELELCGVAESHAGGRYSRKG